MVTVGVTYLGPIDVTKEELVKFYAEKHGGSWYASGSDVRSKIRDVSYDFESKSSAQKFVRSVRRRGFKTFMFDRGGNDHRVLLKRQGK